MRSLFTTSLIMTSMTAFNMGMSLLLQITIAYLFGASWQTDSYFAAWTIPFLIANLLGEPIGLAMIPAMSEIKAKGPPSQLRVLVTTVLLGMGLLTVLLAGISILGRSGLVKAMAPGLDGQPLHLAIELFPLAISAATLGIWLALFSHIHFFERNFIWVSGVNLIVPIVTIGFGFFLAPRIGIKSIPLGAAAGGILACLLLWPRVFGYLGRDLRLGKEAAKFGRNFATIMIAGLPIPMISLIDRYLASGFPKGSISYLAYSWTLTVALVSLLSRGTFAVLFPTLAENVHAHYQDFQRLAAKMIKFFLLLALTLVPVIMFLRAPMIKVVLMHGRFTSSDAVQVAQVLQWHLVGMGGIVLFQAVNRIAYSIGWHSISILGALLQISLYTGGALAVAPRRSISDLAMANGLSWLVTATALLVLIGRKGILGDLKSFVSSAIQSVIVAACLTTALFAMTASLRGGSRWFMPLLLASGAGFLFMTIKVMKNLGVRLRYLG